LDGGSFSSLRFPKQERFLARLPSLHHNPADVVRDLTVRFLGQAGAQGSDDECLCWQRVESPGTCLSDLAIVHLPLGNRVSGMLLNGIRAQRKSLNPSVGRVLCLIAQGCTVE
jgi:hypothetical protein